MELSIAGRKMANGKRFDRHKLTAASWYFPLGTTVRVENVKTGESVVVTITGPRTKSPTASDSRSVGSGRGTPGLRG